MALRVSRALHEPGEQFPFTMEVGVELDRGDFTPAGDALIQGSMSGVGESVAITGEVSLEGEASCCRCLESFAARLTASLDELFVRSARHTETQSEDEDTDVRPFEGEWIDLAPAAEAALLLEMPMRFVCGATCQGLCPSCGKNLNQGGCDCPAQSEENPFSALASLLTDNKEVDPNGSTQG